MPKNHKPHKKDLTPSSQSKAFHQSSFSPSGKVLDLADRSMEGSMGSMANAIAHKLFQPKANSHYPRRHIFSIDGQWQKSLTPQKNLIPTNSSSTRVSTDPSLIFSYGVISSEFVQPTLCIVMTIPAKKHVETMQQKTIVTTILSRIVLTTKSSSNPTSSSEDENFNNRNNG
jgi:hypothetical protein